MTERATVPLTREDDVLLVRTLPAVDPLTEFFWDGGADGRLRFQRCAGCRYFNHPPVAHCARCESTRLEPTPVSGLGTIHTFTVNHQQWVAGQSPYVMAVVRLDEQEDLQMTSNVVGCPPEDVHIGMRVAVRFLHRHDVWYPLFEPCDDAS